MIQINSEYFALAVRLAMSAMRPDEAHWRQLLIRISEGTLINSTLTLIATNGRTVMRVTQPVENAAGGDYALALPSEIPPGLLPPVVAMTHTKIRVELGSENHSCINSLGASTYEMPCANGDTSHITPLMSYTSTCLQVPFQKPSVMPISIKQDMIQILGTALYYTKKSSVQIAAADQRIIALVGDVQFYA